MKIKIKYLLYPIVYTVLAVLIDYYLLDGTGSILFAIMAGVLMLIWKSTYKFQSTDKQLYSFVFVIVVLGLCCFIECFLLAWIIMRNEPIWVEKFLSSIYRDSILLMILFIISMGVLLLRMKKIKHYKDFFVRSLVYIQVIFLFISFLQNSLVPAFCFGILTVSIILGIILKTPLKYEFELYAI